MLLPSPLVCGWVCGGSVEGVVRAPAAAALTWARGPGNTRGNWTMLTQKWITFPLKCTYTQYHATLNNYTHFIEFAHFCTTVGTQMGQYEVQICGNCSDKTTCCYTRLIIPAQTLALFTTKILMFFSFYSLELNLCHCSQ